MDIIVVFGGDGICILFSERSFWSIKRFESILMIRFIYNVVVVVLEVRIVGSMMEFVVL